MKVSEIQPYKDNAKKHPVAQLKQIAKSIKEFGWQQAIVVDKKGVIIVGHGRFFAYEQYKDSYSLPEPVINVADKLNAEQVKAYRLADNKLNESNWDMELVKDELSTLPEDLLEITGFDKSLLDISPTVEAKEVFTTELLEENNYIVFHFDNVVSLAEVLCLPGVLHYPDRQRSVNTRRNPYRYARHLLYLSSSYQKD